jgi:hypothetical protein
MTDEQLRREPAIFVEAENEWRARAYVRQHRPGAVIRSIHQVESFNDIYFTATTWFVVFEHPSTATRSSSPS